ncbi:MAG: restriction endonuclease subunit R [Syntrophobacterales bacterium CG23_combo_of_CG06-09_8_20_14_all_48_27]|nr:MAG: restriction endonuclease subunit R [Syntrophobacterales bacterium CG23_combo_of_CG06-09_8_20_14_all_48_27]
MKERGKEITMVKIPKRVSDRFAATLKNYQGIAISQKDRDVSEADTVTLVRDVLAHVFGYDKYTELTSEQQIRGTYCDLAVKIDGKIKYLIEVKSAGVELNDSHLRQALNYAANQGIEWVVLTNAIIWRLYRIKFGQPIDFELVSSFELPSLSLRNEEDRNKMFLLCREGITSDAMGLYHQHAQMLNKFTVAQVVMSEPVVAVIRRELHRLFPELRVDGEQISDILVNDVLKREVIEGEKVKEAQQKIKKATAKLAHQAEKKQAETPTEQQETVTPQET